AIERLLDHLRVADVAFDLAQPGITARSLQDVFAVEVEVENRDLVPDREKLRHQHGADIASAAGHQDAVQIRIFLVSAHGYASSQLCSRHGATALRPFHAVIEDRM